MILNVIELNRIRSKLVSAHNMKICKHFGHCELMSVNVLRPSHQTLKRCSSGWGKGLSCCPSLCYFIKHICQNELDNERSFLAKHEAVRPTKYLVWQRNGSKNGVPSFDYLRLVADDNIAVAVLFHCLK